MAENYLVLLLIVGIFFISISLIQLKRQRINQSSFVIWALVGIISIIFAVVPFAIQLFQDLLGTQFSVSALLGSSTLFLTILLFYLHQKIDHTNNKITRLVIELGLEKYNKEDLRNDNK